MVTYNLKLLGEDLIKIIEEQVLIPKFIRRDLIEEPFLQIGKEVTLSRPIRPEVRFYPGHGPFYPQSIASYKAVLEREPYVYLPVKNFFDKPLMQLQEETLYPIAEIFVNSIESYFLEKAKGLPKVYPTTTHMDVNIDTVQGMRAFEEFLSDFLITGEGNYTGIISGSLAETFSMYAGNSEENLDDNHLGNFMGIDWYYSDTLDSQPSYHTTGTTLRAEINGDRIQQSNVIPLKNVIPANGTFKKYDTLLIDGVGSVIVANDVEATQGYADVPILGTLINLKDGQDLRLYDGGGYTYQILGIVYLPRALTCVSAVLEDTRIQSTNFLPDQVGFFQHQGYGMRLALQQEYQDKNTAVLFADMLFGGTVSDPKAGIRIVKRVS